MTDDKLLEKIEDIHEINDLLNNYLNGLLRSNDDRVNRANVDYYKGYCIDACNMMINKLKEI